MLSCITPLSSMLYVSFVITGHWVGVRETAAIQLTSSPMIYTYCVSMKEQEGLQYEHVGLIAYRPHRSHRLQELGKAMDVLVPSESHYTWMALMRARMAVAFRNGGHGMCRHGDCRELPEAPWWRHRGEEKAGVYLTAAVHGS